MPSSALWKTKPVILKKSASEVRDAEARKVSFKDDEPSSPIVSEDERFQGPRDTFVVNQLSKLDGQTESNVARSDCRKSNVAGNHVSEVGVANGVDDQVLHEILDTLEQQLSRGFLANAQQMASLRFRAQKLMLENCHLREEIARQSESCVDELRVPDDPYELHGDLTVRPKTYESPAVTSKAASLASAICAGNDAFRTLGSSSMLPALPLEIEELASGKAKAYASDRGYTASADSVEWVVSTSHAMEPAPSSRSVRQMKSTSTQRRTRKTKAKGDDEEPASNVAPEAFELLPFWGQASEKAVMIGATSFSRNSNHPRLFTGYNSLRSAYTSRDLGSIVANPMSRNRIVWESIGAVCIIYDMVVIPLQAFNFGPSGWRLAATWLTVVYWTLDIPCSFFVAYYHRGILQSRFPKTAKHYLSTWFSIDVVIVAFDWIILCLDMAEIGDADELKFVKAGRSLRMLRFLRLLRMLRLHSFFSKVMEQIHSEYLLTILHVTQLMVLIVVVNHFVACGWYGLGDVLDMDPTWSKTKFGPEDDFGYRYTTSLHWSLTQFTPASMEVVPTNTPERTYTVLVVICAMVLFSSFVSSITEAMTHLRKIHSARDNQYAMLRRYFGDRQVSMPLAMRIWRYLEQCVMAKRKRKMYQDVELLKELPEGLQMDLLAEVFEPTMTRHPFFHQYAEANPPGMRALCHQACQENQLFAGQELFTSGHAVQRMYFIVEGTLEYHRLLDASDPNGAMDTKIASAGMWLCEYSLWVHWFHVGTMLAKTPCTILHLDVTQAQSIMLQYVDSLMQCCKYAELCLLSIQSKTGASISDMWMDFDEIQEMSQKAFDLNADVERYESVRSSQRSEEEQLRMFWPPTWFRRGRSHWSQTSGATGRGSQDGTGSGTSQQPNGAGLFSGPRRHRTHGQGQGVGHIGSVTEDDDEARFEVRPSATV